MRVALEGSLHHGEQIFKMETKLVFLIKDHGVVIKLLIPV